MIHALKDRDEGQNEEHSQHSGHETVPQERSRAKGQHPLGTLHDADLALHPEPLRAGPGIGNQERENQGRERQNAEGRAVCIPPFGAPFEHPAHPDRRALAAGEIEIGEPDVERALAHAVERGVEKGTERVHHSTLARHVAVEDVAQSREREDEARGEKGAVAQKERGEEREAQSRDAQVVGHDPPRGEIAAHGPEEPPRLLFPIPVHASSSPSFSDTPSRDKPASARGAPATTTTNSPRGGSDSTHSRRDGSVPRRVSSNFFVNSREMDAGRSTSDSARSRRHSRSLWGDSKKMRVRGSSRNSSMRARRRVSRPRVWRVPSAARRPTAPRIRRARGERSSTFPMGVPTR